MKPKKIIPTVEVVYLSDAAGITAGTVKVLTVSNAALMVAKGIVEIAGARASEQPQESKPKAKVKKK